MCVSVYPLFIYALTNLCLYPRRVFQYLLTNHMILKTKSPQENYVEEIPELKNIQFMDAVYHRIQTIADSPPNSTTGDFRLIFSVPFSYSLFIFYLPRCTQLDFHSVSSLASLPFLPCCHRTITTKLTKITTKSISVRIAFSRTICQLR